MRGAQAPGGIPPGAKIVPQRTGVGHDDRLVENTRMPGEYVRIIVLVVVVTAIAACGLLTEDISRRLGRGVSPRSA